MKYARGAWVVALAVGALACSDNPAEPDHTDHELIVSLTMSTDHLETLEDITFTVAVTDDHGDAVTDFTTIQVEYEQEAEAGTWRSIELTLQGSGDYHFRVSGMRGSETELSVLHQLADHFEIERAHTTLGDYKVEFETFPGHIHSGEAIAARFWIMNKDTGAAVTGLAVTIGCGNPDATTEDHAVTDSGDGVYEAMHTFTDGGDGHMAIQFTDPASMDWEAEFHLHIAHAH
jgi:hypothetical protein